MTYDGTTDFSLDNGQSHVTACDQARALVGAGIPIFPVFNAVHIDSEKTGSRWVCSCGKGAGTEDGHKPGKHPAVPRGHHDAKLLSDEEIAGWWFDGSKGLAFPTGNGIVVIDVDPKNGGIETLESWDEWTQGVSLPETLRCRTGSGGLHLIYSLPIGARVISRNLVLPGIDIKSDGGYVVTASSRHISGNLYHWDNPGHPITVVPADLLNWMLTQRGGSSPGLSVGGTGGVGSGQPDDYDFTQGGQVGQRDTWANDWAFRLRKAGVSWDRAVESLRAGWEGVDQPPGDYFPWETALEKLERVWRTVEPDLTADQSQAAQRMLAGGQGEGSRTTTDVSEDDQPMTGGGAIAGEVLPPATARPVTLEERASDMGNSTRYARLMRDRVRYVPQEGLWYVWDGSRLRVDTLNDALALTREVIDDIRMQALTTTDTDQRRDWVTWAKSSESYGKRVAMLAGAELEPGISLGVDVLDRDPMLLVCQNGTLNLRDGMIRESRVSDLCTKMAGTSFDVNAECPLWLQHIKLITNDNDNLAAYLQRACGYSLTGLVSEQQFFFLWGSGQNGKNVFTETVLGVLGEYAQVAPMGLIAGGDGEHPTILAGLRGARMVMSDETGAGKRMNDARIKMLTGSARISARMMKKDFFEYDSTMKLWILGNSKPVVKDTSEGMWRRMHLVPFINQIPADKRILRYEEQLRDEWPGILNWCLEGLKGWQNLGGLGSPQEVKDAVTEYRREEDLLGQFIEECTVPTGENEGCSTSRMFEAYCMWADMQRLNPREVLSKSYFGREMSSRNVKSKQVKREGVNVRIYPGLRTVGFGMNS
jgi:putative DNA primase/helicase